MCFCPADARPAAAGGAARAAAAAECSPAVHAAPHGSASRTHAGHKHSATLPEHAGPGGGSEGRCGAQTC